MESLTSQNYTSVHTAERCSIIVIFNNNAYKIQEHHDDDTVKRRKPKVFFEDS